MPESSRASSDGEWASGAITSADMAAASSSASEMGARPTISRACASCSGGTMTWTMARSPTLRLNE